MSFSTNAEFDVNQPGLASCTTAQKDLARLQAYDSIVSCLYSGGYGVSAIVAAAEYYQILKHLEIRLTALSLIEGGGASELMGGDKSTYSTWSKKAEETLDKLCAGKLALTNSNTSVTIAPPKHSCPGIITDGREPGVDLTDPLYFQKTETLNDDVSCLE